MSDRIRAYVELGKLRLSSLVVFSTLIGYFLASNAVSDVNLLKVGALCLGGLLVTIAANTINQILEIESDALMKRTMKRPLPTARLTETEAMVFALTAGISLLSFILYGFVYTPMKKISPMAVFVGAFPGAFPPLIGWVAYTGSVDLVALVLFGIQFFWQFPHFWAIAWVADEDYRKAGFKLLPSKEGKNLNSAFQIMIYALLLIPLSILPFQLGITGITSMIIAVICGVIFLVQTFSLMKTCEVESAKKIMFGSFLYLPIVQIAFVVDKI